MQTILNTDRLSLAPIKANDHAFILELLNSRGWIEFIGDRHVHSKEDALAFIEKVKKTPMFTYWVVKLKTDRTSVGIISFLKRDYLEHFDMGFSFLPQYQGRGYAYEAAKAVLNRLKKDPGHAIILASTLPANKKSIGLLIKLGFRFDRTLQVDQETLNIYIHDGTFQ